MSALHTPDGFLPLDCIDIGEVLDADGEVYFAFDYDDEASRERAEFVTRACNSHDELLAALESAAASIQQLIDLKRIPPNNKGLREARAAIAKATGAA